MNLNITRISKLGLLALTVATGATITVPQPIQVQAAPVAMSAKLGGAFKQVTHATKGQASVVGNKLTLSNFETGMGPKLRVYLVNADASSNDAVKKAVAAGKFQDLGALKSIAGNQTYALTKSAPKGSSIVIWCDKFDVAFGAAKLA